MQFNLIDEKWIPIKRRDGTSERIRPWEVTDGFEENPVVVLNAPRPDFNGALIQFLIGLIQTTFAPKNKKEWKDRLQSPPSPGELEAAFAKVKYAFELAGDGPRFMQDYEKLNVRPKSIDFLLIDTPGEKTRRDNTDHFIKRNSVGYLCPSCTASALLTMQTNSPAGGKGYRTSLRGGGPLTTIVIGDEEFHALWHTVWLNVLDRGRFLNMCNADKRSDTDTFPWLARTRSRASERDIHPAHYFWAMPRRIRLNFDDLFSWVCGICQSEDGRCISSYREVNKGTEYQAPMKHPLSPFNVETKKAVLTQPGGVSYRHWLGLVLNDPGAKREPAAVVHDFIFERQQPNWHLRIWAFGYDMDNMKARCWYDATMPLITIDQSMQDDFQSRVVAFVKAAVEIERNTRRAVRNAWFPRPSEVKGDTFFMNLAFWHRTEPGFYRTLGELKQVTQSGTGGLHVRKAWHSTLCNESLRYFDENAWRGPIEDADPKRIVLARMDLHKQNYSKKIKGWT